MLAEIENPDLQLGLTEAARRGVDVRLLVPGTYQNSRMVRYASQTGYRELITAGVRLYVFPPTMMHVKSVSDLRRAKEITLEDIEARPWIVELRNRAARLFREQL